MSDARRKINRRIGYTLGTAGGFFVLLLVAIGVLDSPLLAGISLAGILLAIVAARQMLRCPLCGTSVLNGPVNDAMRWLTGRDRRCPRCRTRYEDALMAVRERKKP